MQFLITRNKHPSLLCSTARRERLASSSNISCSGDVIINLPIDLGVGSISGCKQHDADGLALNSATSLV